MLYQNNLISEKLYSDLSLARFARNDFIHKGVNPSYNESRSALMALILLIEVVSKLNEIIFNNSNLENFISDKLESCIPQTNVDEKIIDEKINVEYWKEMKVIPGDKHWKGEYDSYPDITLSQISTDKDE